MTGDLNTQDINLKDSDVAHGVTNVAATDAYGSLSTIHGTQGGLYINGISDQESASARSLALRGICNDTHTDSVPTVEIIGAKRSGTTVQALADAETILTVANHTATKLSVLGNGNITVAGTVDGVDIATRDAILTSTTTTAGAALPKTGGAMTGAITTNSTFDGVDVATRDSVLSSTVTTAGAALPKAGGTMTGAISGLELGNAADADYNKITNLTSGTAAQDAVAFTQLGTPKNDQTGTTYTLVAADGAGAGKTVRCNNGSTVTVTVPKSIFLAGNVLTIFRKGAGGVTIAPVDGDVTINSVGTRRKLANRYSAATLICVTGGATPEFDLVGDLKA